MSTKTKIIITVAAIGFLLLVAVIFSSGSQQVNEYGVPVNSDGTPIEQTDTQQ